ncbi:MAG: Na(+)-translocating NADH-quinone reductase subunit A [Chlamydiae bacterium]|nr:Na(+)-translocating NADH-quinone reductase subunit A [Chlamydiota bacterium]
MKIVIKKGLDLPLLGGPAGSVGSLSTPSRLSLNLDPFEKIGFRLLVKVGESVKIGQPLAENKGAPGQMFVSPAGGVVVELRRGPKRRLRDIVIEVGDQEEFHQNPPLNLDTASREQLSVLLMQSGLFPHIRMRPFGLVADPKFPPRRIFVSAVESAPYAPSAELQVAGHEKSFQTGLGALTLLTDGKVHLVYREESSCAAFLEASGVEKHSARGPHPIGNPSVHIHHIHPIQNPEDFVWTLSAIDVIAIGKMVESGRYFYERIIALAGEGVPEEKRGFYKSRAGLPISAFVRGVSKDATPCLISGDPLVGQKVDESDFLSFNHTAFSVIPRSEKRQLFHFLGLGRKKFSAFRAYFTKTFAAGYSFTTSQHGERRPFIDGSVYDRVMPMRIPTMELIKAILAEDYDLAQTLGLLEVVEEDFALPAFVCPSKIDMIGIAKQGLHRFSKEMGH